tara:strand:- start:50 stop:784 length:735 start_codon:yes stop_codon:yes gene_type:complete
MKLFSAILISLIFLSSCANENNQTFEANLLVKPQFEFNNKFISCNLNKDFTLINLESFLSNFIKDQSFNNNYDISILFPLSEKVTKFIINYRNYYDENSYNIFLDKLSNKGIDEIASCNFDDAMFQGYSLSILDTYDQPSPYTVEILRCNYNQGYNYGIFRVALDRFISEVNALDILYEAEYLQNEEDNSSFIWINKFYSQDFSNDISSKWFVGSYAAEIKKEFSENANCIDAKIFNAYKISKL